MDQIYQSAYKNHVLRKRFCLATPRPLFELAKKLPGLQAADFHALETWKQAERQWGNNNLPERVSARELMRRDISHFFNKEALRTYVERYKPKAEQKQ